MPDLDAMRTAIEDAERSVDRAIAAMAPMDKMTQLESYVLGYLRACQAVLTKSKDAIDQTHALKRKRSKVTPTEKE